MNLLIVFESVHQAIRAEQLLLKAGLQVELLPTPREISFSCGQSLSFQPDDFDIAREILQREKVAFRGIYSVQPGHRVYELLLSGKTN
jgi:hypothetical protein